MTPQKKQQMVNDLISELRDLKTQVDPKYKEEILIKERMNIFWAQHHSYLGELNKQSEDFKAKIANARVQIENLNRLSEPPLDNEQSILDDSQNVLAESVEPSEAADNDTLQSEKDEPKDISADELLASLETDEKTKKEEILKHFARRWHPDLSALSSATTENDFMTKLNTAFSESDDSGDLLAAIPWDTAWEQRNSGEAIGAQLERLADWYNSLELANERLDQKLATVKNDWRYPLFSDWDKEVEKQAFFTDLASDRRDEVKRLEETLQSLLEEIENMQANGAE